MSEDRSSGHYSSGYSLKLAFDSEALDFVRGFDAGRVYGALSYAPGELHVTVRADNAEMMMRIAETCGYVYRGSAVNEDFIAVVFYRKE